MNVGLEILIPENVSFHMLLEYLSFRNRKNSATYIMIRDHSKRIFNSHTFFSFVKVDFFFIYIRNLTSIISVAFYVFKFKRREEAVLYIGMFLDSLLLLLIFPEVTVNL